jgi:hypothetical protein
MRKILLVVVAAAGLSGYAAGALADCLGDHAPVKQTVMTETKQQTPTPTKPGS